MLNYETTALLFKNKKKLKQTDTAIFTTDNSSIGTATKNQHAHMHACTHTRSHTHTHARTHAHTHALSYTYQQQKLKYSQQVGHEPHVQYNSHNKTVKTTPRLRKKKRKKEEKKTTISGEK